MRLESFRAGGVLVILVLAQLLSGCTKWSLAIPRNHDPAEGSAYVFGRFLRDGPQMFGLIIEDMERTRKYTIEFTDEERVTAIEVEPGDYEITQILFAADSTQAKAMPYYNRLFKAEPNTASYVGDFIASGEPRSLRVSVTNEVRSSTDHYDSARRELINNHPGLARLKVRRAFDPPPSQLLRPQTQSPFLQMMRGIRDEQDAAAREATPLSPAP